MKILCSAMKGYTVMVSLMAEAKEKKQSEAVLGKADSNQTHQAEWHTIPTLCRDASSRAKQAP
jgi:hypothetical protein